MFTDGRWEMASACIQTQSNGEIVQNNFMAGCISSIYIMLLVCTADVYLHGISTMDKIDKMDKLNFNEL